MSVLTASTVAGVMGEVMNRLEEAGVEDVRINAAWLVARVLGVPRARLPAMNLDPFPAAACAPLEALVARRQRGEPLQYLLGEWGFLDFDLEVGPGALIPRYETEEWVEFLIGFLGKRCGPRPFTFADIGTGTGAIGIALARAFPAARGVLVDLSAEALALAGRNLLRCGLDPQDGRVGLVQCSLTDGLAGGAFDLLVSNPPYIDVDELERLQVEVIGYEPRLALDGGFHGLDVIRPLLDRSRRCLKPGGWLGFEHGFGQRPRILASLPAGLRLVEAVNDLEGRDRFLLLEREASP